MTRLNNGMTTSVKVRVAEFQECEGHDMNGADKESIFCVLVLQESGSSNSGRPSFDKWDEAPPMDRGIPPGAKERVIRMETNQEEMDRQVITASTVHVTAATVFLDRLETSRAITCPPPDHGTTCRAI